MTFTVVPYGTQTRIGVDRDGDGVLRCAGDCDDADPWRGRGLREICDAHGILLVFDEVICGFGRTGQTFAAQSFGVTPDLMTMAKGITNGAQPMGAVAVSERVHDTIMAAAAEGAIELFHGYTYSGHPASCAAPTRCSRSISRIPTWSRTWSPAWSPAW